MKNLFNLALLFVSVTSLSIFSGIESGGGGGVVRTASGPVLMDYFTILDDIRDIPQGPKGSTMKKAVMLDFQSLKNLPAFKRADDILSDWASLPYDSMSYLVQSALHSPMNWNFVDSEVKAPPFYLSETIPTEASVDTAAFYHSLKGQKSEVRIKRSIWNELTRDDQSGLLLHETLRQVQLGFRQGFDDQALQRVTAIYLLCRPASRLNYYMFYVLSNSPKMADKIYGPFKALLQTECKRVQ